MTPSPICPSCGTPLSGVRLLGVCPRCFMRGTLAAVAEDAESALEEGGRFHIPGHADLRELARGGMGIVYQARQLQPAREVAVKMLLPQLITGELRERFKLEARTLAALDHPGILPLYQFGEWAELPYFTMKLAAGGTLAARRDRYAGEWRGTAALVMELAGAVACAHEYGVLHRDLKPANILFDDNDRAYVADFGLVKLTDDGSDLTRSTGMLGTPQYLAPEVAASGVRMATVRSDIYSLGAVLYELLAQRPLFSAEGIPALLREIAETDPPPLRRSGVPRDLATIAHTCLAKSPARRYASAEALAADLRAWLAGAPIAARPVSRPEKLWRWLRRHPAISLLSVLLLAALVTGIVLQQQANESLRQSSQESLTSEVHANRESGRWDLRDQGLAAARRAAQLENTLALRNDAITLLATPGCRELDRWPFHQQTWAPIRTDGTGYAEVQEGKLWLRSFTAGTLEDTPVPAPEGDSVFREAVSFSGDDRALLVRLKGDLYRIWQTAEHSWAEVRYQSVDGPRFSHDGKWITYRHRGRAEIVIEDWRQPSQRRTLTPKLTGGVPAGFSPDGTLLAVAGQGRGLVEIYDTATGLLKHSLNNPHWVGNVRASVAWRPDSRALAITTRVSEFFVWNLDGPSPARRRIAGHYSEVDCVAWHPGGEWMASSGQDYTLRLWEVSSGKAGFVKFGKGRTLQFSGDGRHFFMYDSERAEIVRYQLDASSVVHQVALPAIAPDQGMQRGPWGVGVSPDGRFAVVGGTLGTWVLNASSGTLLASLDTGLVNDVTFAPGGKSFWISAAAKGIESCALQPEGGGAWSLTAPRMVWKCRRNITRVSQSAASGLVAASMDDALYFFDPRPGGAEPVRLTIPGMRMNPVAISPDGRWAVSSSSEEKEELAAVWDVEKKSLARRLPDTRFSTMVFSPDSRTLFTASTEGVAAWDTGRWEARWTRPSHGPAKSHAAPCISGDGSTLALSRLSHGVDLFDPATGALLATIDHPDARSVGWIALDHRGSRLAINGSLHYIQLWDLRRLRGELHGLGLDWPAPPTAPLNAQDAEPVKSLTVLPAEGEVLEKAAGE